MADDAPRRQRVKEWGEALDVWTKSAARLGFVGVGIFSGDALIEVLGKVLGG